MSATVHDYDYESILRSAPSATAADVRGSHVPRPKSRTLSSASKTDSSVDENVPSASADVQETPSVHQTATPDDYCERISAHLDACGLSSVQVSMQRGLLTLTGSVASLYEKSLAIDYVRRFAKVSGVSDQLRVVSQNKRESAITRVAGLGIDIGQACIDWVAAVPKSARFLIVGCLALAIAAWLRPVSSEQHIAVYPVSGKVLVDGEVPAGAQIVLHPQGHTLPEGIAATATVHEDGSFSVSIYGDEPGVPPGDYVATVHWFRGLGSESQGKRGVADFVAMASVGQPTAPVVPTIYTNPNSSPLRVTVREDQNELGPIVITRN